MTVKKDYHVGDTVWIHGISPSNKLTQGKVISNVNLAGQGYIDLQYIIEIPTHIEPLLEIRSWQTISQDEQGPVGSLREITSHVDSNNKKIRQIGFNSDSGFTDDDVDPTPDQIMAALKNSTNNLVHKPLNLKDNKQKRKYYPRKKKQ